MTIEPSRVQALNVLPARPDGRFVLYWMQQSQRAAFNPALEWALEAANARDLPLLVGFGLTDGYPEANARHYAFMLEGLAEVAAALARRGIGFVLRRGAPDEVALDLGRAAALIVCDRGYLRPQRAWRARVAHEAACQVVQVEGDAVVPADLASNRHEVGARTLRPKLHRAWDHFLNPLAARPVRRPSRDLAASALDLSDIAGAVRALDVDQGVPPVRRFRGGTSQAEARLAAFLAAPFARYAHDRNRPEAGAASHMSPYLHFGQISPVAIALAVREARAGGAEDRSAYLEELIVRRELAINHVLHEERYDAWEAVPAWARRTLDAHRDDPRPHLYDAAQLEAGETHDRHWNAAMLEMRATGYMHNHMRMYWGKKIIEWSPTPEAAFGTALRLNNRHFLDGRDANSFANVAWLFGLHDRPWAPRPVFGNVRYLGANTLRKFDADDYVREVERLATAERG